MAHLNHRGPEEKGPGTGRRLGKCKSTKTDEVSKKHYQLGEGIGRNKKKESCFEHGKRLKAGKHID